MIKLMDMKEQRKIDTAPEMIKDIPKNNEVVDPFAELERAMHTALETYSNVHRGSGHNSMVTTYLYEQARDIILEYLGLKKGKYNVIFCTPPKSSSSEGTT